MRHINDNKMKQMIDFPSDSLVARLAKSTLLVLSLVTISGCSSVGMKRESRSPHEAVRAELFDATWVSPKLKGQAAYTSFDKIYIAPVYTGYLQQQSWWASQNVGKRSTLQQDANQLGARTHAAFSSHIARYPNAKFRLAGQPSPGTLVLEIAIVELVPSKRFWNMASSGAGFAVPGAGFLSAVGKGKIGIEGRVSDGATGEVLGIFKDTEIDKSALISIDQYTWYLGAEENIDDWAKGFAELINTPPSHVVEDTPRFKVSSW
jgi:hypothetical protein